MQSLFISTSLDFFIEPILDDGSLFWRDIPFRAHIYRRLDIQYYYYLLVQIERARVAQRTGKLSTEKFARLSDRWADLIAAVIRLHAPHGERWVEQRNLEVDEILKAGTKFDYTPPSVKSLVAAGWSPSGPWTSQFPRAEFDFLRPAAPAGTGTISPADAPSAPVSALPQENHPLAARAAAPTAGRGERGEGDGDPRYQTLAPVLFEV